MQNYREEAKKQRHIICTLERERDRYGKDAADAQQNCMSQMEEVKMKEMQLYQLKKKIAENESKLKQQQVRNEHTTHTHMNTCNQHSIDPV